MGDDGCGVRKWGAGGVRVSVLWVSVCGCVCVGEGAEKLEGIHLNSFLVGFHLCRCRGIGQERHRAGGCY